MTEIVCVEMILSSPQYCNI